MEPIGGDAPELSQEDANWEKAAFWCEMMNRVRQQLLGRKEHIKAYYKVRNLHSEVCTAMAGEISSETVTHRVDPDCPPAIQTAFDAFCDELDLDQSQEENMYYDLMIYQHHPKMNCVTGEFLRKHRYRRPEKIELLQSMLDSRLGLYEITGTDPDEGYVYLRDLITGSTYSNIDVALSGSDITSTSYLYIRIISYHGISFGTGMILIFDKADPFIHDLLRQWQAEYDPGCELIRFHQLYRHSIEHPSNIRPMVNYI